MGSDGGIRRERGDVRGGWRGNVKGRGRDMMERKRKCLALTKRQWRNVVYWRPPAGSLGAPSLKNAFLFNVCFTVQIMVKSSKFH
jgi:hypothetical protein